MQRSAMLLPIVYFMLIYNAQMASSQRCMSLSNRIDLPETCAIYYDDGDGYFSESTLSGLQNAFQRISNMVRSVSDSNQCVELMTNFLCHYYFPLCNQTTGEIIPVCNHSCALTLTDEDCSSLREIVNGELEQDNVTSPKESCSQTYHSFSNPSSVSKDCFSIYVSNDTVNSIPEANDDDGNDNTILIICAAIVIHVVLVIVIVLVAAILCLKRRNKRRKRIERKGSSNERLEQPSIVRYHDHPDLNSSNATSLYLTVGGMNIKRDDILKASKSSLLLEANHLLDYVKDKFSEVLLPVNAITKQHLLGKGAFGVVHKGEMVLSDGSVKAVAIKTIKSGSLDGMKDLVAESSIMKAFHHPNVLPLLGVCIDYDDEDVLKIVIPFMVNGDLKTFLKDSRVSPNNTHEYPKDLSEEKLLEMCFDIAKGMEYLAAKRFIHRDLAARNCMVDNLLSIRIADFGLAKDVYSTEYYRVEKHTTLPVKWMAIESLLDGYFDEKTDVWSYGITCWEIFSLGRIPYPGVDNSNIIALLKTGKRLEKPELCPLHMNELIKSTWIEDPNERPTFATIVQELSRSFTIVNEIEDTINDDVESTNSIDGYISVVPK